MFVFWTRFRLEPTIGPTVLQIITDRCEWTKARIPCFGIRDYRSIDGANNASVDYFPDITKMIKGNAKNVELWKDVRA